MRPKVLVTRRWPAEAEARLAEGFDVTLNEGDQPLSPDELRAAMGRFDALCPTVTDRIDAFVLDAPDARVRMIANYGVGTDNIDVAAARARGIVVSNTPGVLTDATAELAVLLMLAAARRAGEGEREVRAGRWSGWRPTHLMGAGLSGRTLGLVGFGRIGQATAERARGFGLSILYHSRTQAEPEVEARYGAAYRPSLEALLAEADLVSLHCPGGAATRHLISEARLRLMKPTAILVNTARGTVVDEAALARALAEGRIAAAGLDVFEREPQVPAELLGLENVVLLPHMGSATVETRTAMGLRVAANLESFFRAGRAQDPVA
jgi:lactate dehydrogenase-like 2-hydroxyacid dehydrogenase